MYFRKSPVWFRMINGVWRSLYFAGAEIDLDKDTLIRAARKITGLHDLGSDFNIEPLEKLLWSVEHEADLSPVGRFITKERFVSLLSIRLKAEEIFRKNPQILQQELYPAWFIIGLQRTGTTKLQRLLAQDSDHRVIPSWEVINPVPINPNLYNLTSRLQSDDPDFHHLTISPSHHLYPHPRDKRISVAKTSVSALKLMSPGFFAVHPIDAMQPEEDILLLDISFMSTTPEAMMHVPAYAHWLEQTDQSDAYAYAAKLLKFMQWIRPARRWVLKSPHHLEFPGLIEKYFNDVHFIWPHRSPDESVPSFLSMVTYNRMIFSDRVDVHQIAEHWVTKVGYMLDQALEYRLQPGNDSKFTDIFYKDLITDSMAEMARIYNLNGGLTPELLELFRQHEADHPHRKNGVHNYSLEDFGLTKSDIDRHTDHYRKFIDKQYGAVKTEKI